MTHINFRKYRANRRELYPQQWSIRTKPRNHPQHDTRPLQRPQNRQSTRQRRFLSGTLMQNRERTSRAQRNTPLLHTEVTLVGQTRAKRE